MAIKKLKTSYFRQTFYLLKNNKDNAFLIFIFDVWFFAALLLFTNLAESLGISLFRQPLQSYSTAPLMAFILAYYLILIVIYSFFKFIVLHYLKKMFGSEKINFKRFGSFLLLNFIIMLSLFGIFIALNGILLLNVKSQIAPYVFLLILVPFAFFSYAIINIAHSLFVNLTKIREILEKTIKIAFTNIKSYGGIYLSGIIIFSIYFAVYYLVGSALSKIQSYAMYFNIYLKVFTILTGIVIYLIIFFNRAYFYLIVKEKFLKK
ncbi:hypothetical protein J4458_00650 [Candidatus Woesearchaeota archaeon]|nr:hypothetical protein [Candidatus Woesearchaeota archaeon]